MHDRRNNKSTNVVNPLCPFLRSKICLLFFDTLTTLRKKGSKNSGFSMFMLKIVKELYVSVSSAILA